jgi:transposase
VFVALDPVDMRYGHERLSGLVRERLGYEPRGGALFVFMGKRRETVKIVFADATGVCLFYKRLDRSTFALPEREGEATTHVEVDEATLQALLDGIELTPAPASPSPGPRRRAPRRVH